MTGQDDFIARALSSLSQQMALANAAGGGAAAADDKNSILDETIEAHAKSLVDDDTPKIDSAVKSYLSLVAARSVVASEIDVLSENVKSFDDAQMKLNSMDMKSALTCARKLLNGINTTVIPKRNGKEEEEEKDECDGGSNNEINDETQKMMDAATHIVWNRLVEHKDLKPSKVLGRKSLIVSWPYIEERFRRGADSTDDASTNVDALLRSCSIEILPAIAPPQGIELDSWIAYYTEFGSLLSKACQNDKSKQEDGGDDNEDDSKLLWANDKGVSELQRRQDRRAKRAESLTQSKNDAEKESVAEE
eukprot:CAMPEP_0201694528 /NCGR_PEP_ID=MMETSP0578-20130828/6761_1 /ASSEMBLY_ACC=CAM_ASM_000663 /TAXON_ID=267565 /ORGANISM="Skeletonema grethea, Strain CCMP 1804" /LENGTH=305 /DNA_ID=CAMNT_0048180215 /DNA_START=22 /DNA_END=939 /DNA_ORIENTATION=+